MASGLVAVVCEASDSFVVSSEGSQEFVDLCGLPGCLEDASESFESSVDLLSL